MQIPYVCLYCDRNFSARLRAKTHSCPEKQDAERRLGVKLATYDPVSRFLEIEASKRS